MISFNLAKGYKPKCLGLKGLESFPAAKVAGPFFVAAVFACGNCDNLIVYRYGRPIRCSKCGKDIDWSEDTSRKKILFCSQCGRANFQSDVDKYCDSCPTKVELKTTEIVGR